MQTYAKKYLEAGKKQDATMFARMCKKGGCKTEVLAIASRVCFMVVAMSCVRFLAVAMH